MTQVMTGPTASLLLYLAPQPVVQAHGPIPGTNVQVPGADVKVNRYDLANVLMASAFWELRTLGILDLAVVESRVLFMKTKHVQVTLKQQAERGGIQGSLVRLAATKPNQTAKQIVQRWFGKDVLDPWGVVIRAVQQEGLALGYLHPVARGIMGTLKNQLPVEADATALASMQPAYASTAQGWLQFQAAEPALATQLLHDCSSAINSRREQQSVDIDF